MSKSGSLQLYFFPTNVRPEQMTFCSQTKAKILNSCKFLVTRGINKISTAQKCLNYSHWFPKAWSLINGLLAEIHFILVSWSVSSQVIVVSCTFHWQYGTNLVTKKIQARLECYNAAWNCIFLVCNSSKNSTSWVSFWIFRRRGCKASKGKAHKHQNER